MTDERWQRMQAIFEEALDHPPYERSRFLDETCGEDRDLRAEVERLLAHDREAPSEFMRPLENDSVARMSQPIEEADALIGTTIGQYRIKSVIASGGMGTVYLAEQANPKRDVALKILRSGIASPSMMKRFEYESQILARLKHPNIAQVYEAGIHTPDQSRDREGVAPLAAVPYFAMEYVPIARMITEYTDEARLSILQRLELFLQVCDAVHHGHQRGIIHRDLKPGNILVDGAGHVKIIDFGVARCTDSDITVTTMHTDVGQLIGTLQYMSPEQCAADALEIDTRSDVYSLGVVLYELLTGRLPYDVSNMTIYSAARVISEKPPTKPSGFERRLRGDLEMILFKALEKDLDKRYASAASLSEDVQRYLQGESISVRPPTAWTRGIRWVGRHPLLGTTCLCLFIGATMLAASSVAVWWWSVQPHRIVRYRDGQLVSSIDRNIVDEVKLMARNGATLHTWGDEQYAIACADLVERPEDFGGGQLAVIGYSIYNLGRYAKRLCAFDIHGSLDKPLWVVEIATDDVLPILKQERGYSGSHFCIRYTITEDVFPGDNYPGKEIVAVFSPETSQYCIRIYDLEGTRLYEAWHEGAVVAPYWLEEAELLLFAGDNQLENWHNGRLLSPKGDPLVVFALRPAPGDINSNDFLPIEPGDGPSSPVWYKCLYQEGDRRVTIQDFSVLIQRPTERDSGRYANIEVYVQDHANMMVKWTIDHFGKELPNTRNVNRAYQKARRKGSPVLPDPDLFELRPMRPIEPRSDSSEKTLNQLPHTP